MVHKPANLNTISGTIGTLVQANGIRNNTKTYSTATDAVNRSTSQCLCLFRTLFNNSILVTTLTIGLVFGLIQESAASLTIPARTDVTRTYSTAWTVNRPMFSHDTAYNPETVEESSVISSGLAVARIYSTKASTTPFTRIAATSTSVISPSYSGILSSNSPTFSRQGVTTNYYYYQAIRVAISKTGTYTFTSSSSVDTYGYFYNDPADPSYPSRNLITSNDDGGGGRQFQIDVSLHSGLTYFLVVTTFSEMTSGSFSIRVVGPTSVGLASMTLSTSMPMRTTTTTSPVISSSYSGILSSNSPIFSRPSVTTSYHYYQAIQVTISLTGTYTFTSSSRVDTYGYFYDDPLYPSYPSLNLITSNDDGNGDGQFRIDVYLQSGRKYVLVVTTLYQMTTGSFSISAIGPASPVLVLMTPSTIASITTPSTPDHRLETLTIVGITFGCIIFCLIILVFCVRQYKRKMASNQQNISLARNQTVQVQVVPWANINRNTGRANEIQVPYPGAMSAAWAIQQEEPPPSYDSVMSTAQAR